MAMDLPKNWYAENIDKEEDYDPSIGSMPSFPEAQSTDDWKNAFVNAMREELGELGEFCDSPHEPSVQSTDTEDRKLAKKVLGFLDGLRALEDPFVNAMREDLGKFFEEVIRLNSQEKIDASTHKSLKEYLQDYSITRQNQVQDKIARIFDMIPVIVEDRDKPYFPLQ